MKPPKPSRKRRFSKDETFNNAPRQMQKTRLSPICVSKPRSTVRLIRWSCAQVRQFVLAETGDEDLADSFVLKGVDGGALALLTCQDLVQYFNMNLGTARRFKQRVLQLSRFNTQDFKLPLDLKAQME